MANLEANVVVIPGRFSYSHVWEPHSPKNSDSEPKYQVSILWDKSDKKTTRAVEAAIEAAKQRAIDNGKKLPKNLVLPLKDGDEDRDEEVYEGKYFVNAKNKNQPAIVDAKRKPILDRDEFYSGCYGYAVVSFYFSDLGKAGIYSGLEAVMKTKDGDALGGGRISVEDAFAGISDESDNDDDI